MKGTTLDLALECDAEDIHEPEFVAYEPLVSFAALLSDRCIFGWVRLDADRLTDLLNAHRSVHLVNVRVEDNGDGSISSADEASISRSDIIGIVAGGPRGDPARRRETRSYAVVVESGTYRIGGRVHAAPGLDPRDRWYSGGPMVPLTDAWLEYRCGGEKRRERTGTIIVNRGRTHRVHGLSRRRVATSGP